MKHVNVKEEHKMNRTLLHDEIVSEIEELSKKDTGSEEYQIAVNGVTKLMDKELEWSKLDNEIEQKNLDRESAERLKLKEIEEDRKDKRIKNTLTGVSIIGGFGLTIWGALKSWEFEKEGTVTSAFGQIFLKGFRPN